MALIIASAALAGILWGMMARAELEKKIAAMEAGQAEVDRSRRELAGRIFRLDNAVTLLSHEQVDLANSGVQHLRDGFAVGEIHTERRDTGVLVQGRLVNASTLGHRAITFRVKVGNSAQEIKIGNLPPGGSGAFSVVLPNVPIDEARTATFSLVSSAVEYDR
jgi:hypothetical protein